MEPILLNTSTVMQIKTTHTRVRAGMHVCTHAYHTHAHACTHMHAHTHIHTAIVDQLIKESEKRDQSAIKELK